MNPANPANSDQKHYGAGTQYSQPPATGLPVSPNTQYPSNYSPARVAWSTGLFDCFSDVKGCKHPYHAPYNYVNYLVPLYFFFFLRAVEALIGYSLATLNPIVAGCITFWCPCITFGQIAEIVDRGSTSCGASGALYALITFISAGFPSIYSCFYRTKLREQYMLEERPCCDCLVHFCCEPCALCQEHRELQNRGYNMGLGWNGSFQQQNRGGTMTPTPPTIEPGMTR